MWVRIDEIVFAPERADDVIHQVRDTAVSQHDGEGFRGFRLLVDRHSGRALDVSYWDSRAGAVAGGAHPAIPTQARAATTRIRSDVYELSIDAV